MGGVVVYGLAVHGVSGLDGRAYATDRSLAVRWVDDERSLAAAWSADGAERVSEAFAADGTLAFTVDEHPLLGWRIWAQGDGCFVLSGDGRSLVALAPGGDRAATVPLLLGQVLPFAAVLQGLEVFHAAAVVVPGGDAVVFTGASESGKTSLAIRSVLAGARLLTDDVLALERLPDDRVIAHPGPRRASLRASEAERLSDRERALLGLGEPDDEGRLLARPPCATGPAPPAHVYFADRSADTTSPRSAEAGGVASRDEPFGVHFAAAGDPRLLLASTFNFVVLSPERLARQLDVCAALARQATLLRVGIPAGASAADVAAACLDRAREPVT